MPKTGIVAVAGKPNAGKSTLLNRIVGEKLSIVSPKPQSTRDRIVGIRTTDDMQMVLLDMPGLLNPCYALQEAMRSTALRALEDADVILYLNEAGEGVPPSLEEAAQLAHPPAGVVITVLNKVDTLPSARRTELLSAAPDALQVSALTGEGVAELLTTVASHLPESPFLYPEDELSTHPVRFFVAEFIRETALEQLEEEVPYSVACEVEEYREDRAPIYIRAVLYVERESQKRILIGAGGSRIRELGQRARQKIEAFVGAQVYLDLWVKVLHNWRRKPAALGRLGYRVERGRR